MTIHSQNNQGDSLTAEIQELIARQPPGHSMLGPFYSHPDIYQLDLATVWRRGWLFACHSCEVSQPGDYIALNVDVDSILVARADDGRAYAVHNVCRHRGSRLTEESCGHARRL